MTNPAKTESAPPAWFLHTLLLGTMIMWAMAFVAIKYLEDVGVEPVELTLLRFMLAAIGFSILLVGLRVKARLPGIKGKEEWARLIMISLLGVACYHLCLNYGEQFTTAGTASIIIASSPAMTFLLAILLLKERSSSRRIAGLTLAFVGVVVLVLMGGQSEEGGDHLTGMVILALAPLAWALYNVIGKPLFAAHDPLAITAYLNILGLLFILPLASHDLLEQTGSLEFMGWLALLFLGFGSTLLATLFYNTALRHLSATRVAGYIYLVPLMATGMGLLLLDESLSFSLLAGSTMILGGVALVQLGARQGKAVSR